MEIAIIAAVSENNVIGNKNKIPWHLPADLKYFKKTTLGHPVIMGQNTYESIGKPLPKRVNIILSDDKDYKVSGCFVFNSIPEAIDYLKNKRHKKAFVIGGASIYKQFINTADEIYLTRVLGNFNGDTYFPQIDADKWKVFSQKLYPKDDNNPYDMVFIIYNRRL